MKSYMRILCLVALSLLAGSFGLRAQTEDELIDICNAMAGPEATYLRDFKVRIDASNPPTIQRYPIILKKGNKYRFTIVSSKDKDGELKLDLFDSNRLMASTVNPATGADYPTIDWICTKTGAYHLFFSFKEGKAGMGVGILSLVDGES